MSEKRVCDSCIHRSYPTGQRYEYLALEFQKECFKIKDIPIEKKNCGHCKHFQVDGMFGFWCEKDHDWTLVNGNCSDFER